MFKALRKKLAILAACLTGSVVLVLCLVSFCLVCNQYLQSRSLAFRLASSAVCTQWQMDGFLSAGWLSASMEANDIEIALWENEIPIDYGFSNLETAHALLQSAPQAEEGGGSFYVTQGYRCARLDIPFAFGNRQLLVWQETGREGVHLVRLGLTFVGIAAAGLTAVAFLCYWVAGRAIAPAQEAMERQERFVADASHELRGPLTVLRTGFGVVRSAPAEGERYLGLMSLEVDRMTRLVDELLLLAGGGSLAKCFRPEPVELDTLLLDFADTMTPVAGKLGLSLDVALPEEPLPPVPGDVDRLRQLLTILVDNALRYAPSGSSIQLSLAQRGPSCLLAVADHGPGVPDGEKKRIFDRFYRGSQSREDPAHFGLGLSVARELTEIHGGRLTVTDTPGGGATFCVTLPYG